MEKDEFDRFKHLTSKVLDFHVTLKEKHVKEFKKTKTNKNRRTCKKQRNYCVKLLKRSKKNLCNISMSIR